MTVGDRIKQRRIELDLTQEELAYRIGYASKTSVNKAEKNANEMSISNLEKYAAALDCDPAYLVGWQDSPRRTVERLNAYATKIAKLTEKQRKAVDAVIGSMEVSDAE